MKAFKKLFVFASMIIPLLCGCSATNNHQGKKITDMGGVEINLPTDINRVVVTSEPCADMMLTLGLSSKIVGAYYRILNNAWFEAFCPNCSEITPFKSYTPEAESLIALGTDLVIVPSPERAEELNAKGILSITMRFYTPAEVVNAVNLLGVIFGGDAKSRGKEWLKDFENAKNYAASKLTSEDNKPVAYEVLAAKGRGPFSTYYGEGQAWLSFAGGELATKDFEGATSSTMPSEEAILATNPDIIFIGGLYATKEYADLLVDEKWSEIAAVKNRNIHIEPMGPFSWNNGSTCYTLLIYYCFSCMYPEKVDFDMKQKAHDFYLKYYQKDCTANEMDLMFNSLAPDGSELWE